MVLKQVVVCKPLLKGGVHLPHHSITTFMRLHSHEKEGKHGFYKKIRRYANGIHEKCNQLGI